MNEILKIVEVLAEIPLIREFFQSLMIIYLSYESIIIFIDIPKYIKIGIFYFFHYSKTKFDF